MAYAWLCNLIFTHHQDLLHVIELPLSLLQLQLVVGDLFVQGYPLAAWQHKTSACSGRQTGPGMNSQLTCINTIPHTPEAYIPWKLKILRFLRVSIMLGAFSK